MAPFLVSTAARILLVLPSATNRKREIRPKPLEPFAQRIPGLEIAE